MTGIRVIGKNGSPVARSQVWLRTAMDAVCFAPAMLIVHRSSPRYAALVPLVAVYGSALFDRERRCPHDFVAGTRVVRS